jgi:hypothetical protein
MKKTVKSEQTATVRPFRFVSFKKIPTSEHERIIATFMLIPIIIVLLIGTARIERIKTVEAVAEQSDYVESIIIPTIVPVQTIGGAFKAYERVDKITLKTSKQYYLKQLYWTDSEGFCRFNQMYVVAMGSKWGQRIGQIFTIELSGKYVEFDGASRWVEGRTFKAILGDVKRDSDVIDGVCKTNGSIIEFIVSNMDGDRLQQIMSGEIIRIEEDTQQCTN